MEVSIIKETQDELERLRAMLYMRVSNVIIDFNKEHPNIHISVRAETNMAQYPSGKKVLTGLDVNVNLEI